ncbi:AAA family ATPase [Candidatus Pacearchaeota archaeon]|jgi:nitric oxide reductase NorQ protein|nr:AAA family ATPase [Candidatus Pacearchaeota archaeon]|tara:strand:+ start:2974 stop:3822 length:849 start_codon:yes stop_codon:yes gene_type:complete
MEHKDYISDKGIDYIPQGDELDVALTCYNLKFPLMLRGPTGVGKTTLVTYLSRYLQKPLIEESCNEDTLAADLIGRNLPSGWLDGSATKSLRYEDGAIYYLDELGEARQDAIVVVHSLTDDRRTLEVRAHDEVLESPDEWMLIASYNPLYQLQNRVKPSTAQRFVTVDIPFPRSDIEGEIVESFLYGGKVEKEVKQKKFKKRDNIPINDIVKLANDYRKVAKSSDSFGLREGPGTRLVARTAKLIEYGLPDLLAIEVGMINPLTYDPEQKEQMFDIAKKLFR